MIGLSPYPAYQASEEPWLGPVPRAWELVRSKVLLRERSEKGHPDEPPLAATQTKGVVRKEDYENRTVVALKDLQLLKLVREGDFVISLRSFQGGIEFARDQGIISPAYTVLYPRDADLRSYLAWVFKSQPYVNNLSLYVTGIRQGQTIDYERLSRSRLPVPPPNERAAIVRFLDHADRRIRRYIAAKRKLVALLDEQKQAIVRRAVVMGLEPFVRTASSGVDWLDEVPEHWDIRRLRFLADIATGDRDTVDSRADGAYPFFVRSQHVERIGSYSFDGEAVLTAGDGAGVAKVFHYVDGKFDFHQRVYRFSGFDRALRGRFFFHYLSANLRYEAFRETAKSTVDSLRRPMLANFPVLLPPVEEQDRIVRHIEAATATIEVITHATKREIGLLLEYRARLIADVVTGKVDVRSAAARLPSEETGSDDDIDLSIDGENEPDPAHGDPT